MEAYAAVHNQQAREEGYSSRDAISEMNLSQLTDSDLNEIVEEVLEDIFEVGYSVDEAYNIFADMFVQSEIAGRQQKIDRLCEALNVGFELVESKSAVTALEEFRKYRHGKKLQETWSDRLQQDKRVQKHHGAIIAQESLNVRNLLVQLFNEKSGGKDENPAKEEEKLRKDDDLFGSPNKKKKKVSEAIDAKGAARMGGAKPKKKVDVFAYDRKLQAQGKLKGKKLPPPPTNEEVEHLDEISKGSGYNARLDDSLGAKHGKKSQSLKSRRDESEGMEKSKGKRKFSGDKSMDEMFSQDELDAITEKVKTWAMEG